MGAGEDMANDLGKRARRNENSASPKEPADGMRDTHDEPSIDPRLDRLIGRSLQAHYADIVRAPLPDTILVLLAQLEAKERDA